MSTQTAVFVGASTGVGLSALKSTLAAGTHCIAVCRTPEKLTKLLPLDKNPNLQVVQGNAHDAEAMSTVIVTKDNQFVDTIVSTIGAAFDTSRFTIDDPNVCAKGMNSLLEAINKARGRGVVGRPHILVCSTTGMSDFGRDVPYAFVPLYHVMLKVPHKDKKIMETTLAASGESYTIIRASLLTNGASESKIRVGIEDPKTGRESAAIGYTISREDAGRWFAENAIVQRREQYINKIATITYWEDWNVFV